MGVKFLGTVFFPAVLCGVALLFASGCAATRTNLVENGAVSLELASGERIIVDRAYAFEQNNELIVSGRVKRRHSEGLGGGDVEIVVISPAGAVIGGTIVPYYPRIIPREGARESTFIARIPEVPPRGSTIQVKYRGY